MSEPIKETQPTTPLCKDIKNQYLEFSIKEEDTNFVIKRPRPMHKKKKDEIVHTILVESGEEECVEELNHVNNMNSSSKVNTYVEKEDGENDSSHDDNIIDSNIIDHNEDENEDIKEIKINFEEEEEDEEGCLHENENIIFTKTPSELTKDQSQTEDKNNKDSLEKDCGIGRINIEQNKRSIISLIGIEKFNDINNFYRNKIEVKSHTFYNLYIILI